MTTFNESAAFEHGFWLKIMADHSTFILDSLAEKEKMEIAAAKEFVRQFKELATKVKSNSDLIKLALDAEASVRDLRTFKLELLKKQLTSQFVIHLSPTFINHMVNELDEYLLMIGYLKKGEKPPVFHELHHHLLWTSDAAGHAGAISDSLDAVEKRLKNKSDEFTKHFEQFYLKAVELTGYLRTNLDSFPALKRMNKEVKLEIEVFQLFLNEIEELEISNQMLSVFSPLMADHMMREECYYLVKLAESTNTQLPNCSPIHSKYN